MSIAGFFASGVWSVVFGLLFLVMAVFLVYFLAIVEGGWEKIIGTVFFFLGIVFCIWGFFFSMTHRVVPVNERGIVYDATTGSIVGEPRGSGLTSIPFFGSRIVTFPASINYQACQDFTPSVKGGYEVKLTTCFYIDASQVDWVLQFKRYNQFEVAKILEIWRNQVAPNVAGAMKEYTPQQLTYERDTISQVILKSVKPWFDKEGIPVNSVSLVNWDFTNKDVSAAFDQTILANTKQAQEQALFDASKVKRDRELFEADTRVQVANRVATGQKDAMQVLGIKSEEGVLQWFMLQWLQGLPTPPGNLILSLGEKLPVAVPTK